jgi:hypothetical protein
LQVVQVLLAWLCIKQVLGFPALSALDRAVPQRTAYDTIAASGKMPKLAPPICGKQIILTGRNLNLSPGSTGTLGQKSAATALRRTNLINAVRAQSRSEDWLFNTSGFFFAINL